MQSQIITGAAKIIGKAALKGAEEVASGAVKSGVSTGLKIAGGAVLGAGATSIAVFFGMRRTIQSVTDTLARIALGVKEGSVQAPANEPAPGTTY